MKVIAISMSMGKTQYLINKAYIEYISEAGFLPLLITPEIPAEVALKRASGLLLPGGIDVDPIYYGEDNHASFVTDPAKDEFERDLLHTAIGMQVPVFGICRGFQLIARELIEAFNVGGNVMYFQQHIGSHNQVDNQNLTRNIHQHFVEHKPEILYGAEHEGDYEHIPVNSMHHQCLTVSKKAIKDIVPSMQLPENFNMAAWTDRGLGDQAKTRVICESFATIWNDTRVFGVQWHPEELKDIVLLKNFFDKKPAGKANGA